MELHELADLISGLKIEPTDVELKRLYAEFKRDFEGAPLVIDGLTVKVILTKSFVQGFESYPETFVHLITRKGQGRQRSFDRHRANKIHWIRCILENRHEPEVIHFQYPEAGNKLRDYFWYKEGDFLVIMERVTLNILIVTSFHIDDERNRKYFAERARWYRNNRT